MLLRENNVFSMRDVAYALFETNGSISVLRQMIRQAKTMGKQIPLRKGSACQRVLLRMGVSMKQHWSVSAVTQNG